MNNYDVLRVWADANRKHGNTQVAAAALAVLDENAALRAAIAEHLEDCPLYYEQEMDVDGMPYGFSLRKALGDAS